MKQSRYFEEWIIGILREHECGVRMADLYRRHGMNPDHFANGSRSLAG